MATGIRSLDKIYRDLLTVYDALKNNSIAYDGNLFYFEKGDGSSILYSFAKTIENLDSINRALEYESRANVSWWQKFVNYLKGASARHGARAFWNIRTNMAQVYDKFKSNIASRDGNVIYFKSRDGGSAMYSLRSVITEIDETLRNLEAKAYLDRPWWAKLMDILWARVPY